ncbi:MAG: hypothetical protein ACKOPT_05640 [Cyanobium sp.]
MQSTLEISHKALQTFASAPGRGEMIGYHASMAEIQQQGSLLGGEAQQMLVVVMDDLHEVCKRHCSFVGRNPTDGDRESRHSGKTVLLLGSSTSGDSVLGDSGGDQAVA